MQLQEEVAQAFASGGALDRATPGYRERPGQTRMALAVAETLIEGGALVVEAGTGVGKTYSYLVPALLSGERVLVSTATKTLQDQLFARDLPAVAQALGLPVRAALLKGRGSYLCAHRLEVAREAGSFPDRATVHALAKIETWARTTRSGDLAELAGLDERSPLIPLVTSTRDNCLGAQCPKFKGCHVNQARREAMAADVVVINHHLFFADLAVRESGMAELLPSVRVAIFDEAHQLNETGVQFLGRQLTSGQLIDLARDTLGTGLQRARGLVDWTVVAGEMENAARELRHVAGRPSSSRVRWSSPTPEGMDPDLWHDALARTAAACRQAQEALSTVSEIAPDFVRLAERGRMLAERAEAFLAEPQPGSVRWIDAGAQMLRLVESPLDIAETIRSKLLGERVSDEVRAKDTEAPWSDDEDDADADDGFSAVPPPDQEPSEPLRRAFIFTSATLGDDARLSWFTEPCGLQDAQVLQVESPFDYARQAAVYVPRQFPRPNEPGHAAAVARIAGNAARELGGRTMVLTTTLRALREIGDSLAKRFADDLSIEVLVQGQWPKRRLMERLREGGGDGRPGVLLVASASFWEGVDVPGEALQLVVIDKLPFPPPGDPLVEARSERLKAEGRRPFDDFSLPEAAVALKQGAGRLIRREEDRGVLAICDVRLATMGYGRRLMAALPPMRAIASEAGFAEAITRISTRDPSSL